MTASSSCLPLFPSLHLPIFLTSSPSMPLSATFYFLFFSPSLCHFLFSISFPLSPTCSFAQSVFSLLSTIHDPRSLRSTLPKIRILCYRKPLLRTHLRNIHIDDWHNISVLHRLHTYLLHHFIDFPLFYRNSEWYRTMQLDNSIHPALLDAPSWFSQLFEDDLYGAILVLSINSIFSGRYTGDFFTCFKFVTYLVQFMRTFIVKIDVVVVLRFVPKFLLKPLQDMNIQSNPNSWFAVLYSIHVV